MGQISRKSRRSYVQTMTEMLRLHNTFAYLGKHFRHTAHYIIWSIYRSLHAKTAKKEQKEQEAKVKKVFELYSKEELFWDVEGLGGQVLGEDGHVAKILARNCLQSYVSEFLLEGTDSEWRAGNGHLYSPDRAIHDVDHV